MAGTETAAPLELQRVPAARLHDWQLRLAELIAQRSAQPFAWGERDCCLWAADAVQAVTGVDLAAGLRGTYDSALSAGRVLRASPLDTLAAAALGQEVLPALAQPGDIGLMLGEAGPTLVVEAGGVWLAQGEAGLVPVVAECVTRAWRCTCPQP